MASKSVKNHWREVLATSHGQLANAFMGDHDAIIIGGGPAMSSAAIRLAERAVRVLVLEEKCLQRCSGLSVCRRLLVP